MLCQLTRTLTSSNGVIKHNLFVMRKHEFRLNFLLELFFLLIFVSFKWRIFNVYLIFSLYLSLHSLLLFFFFHLFGIKCLSKHILYARRSVTRHIASGRKNNILYVLTYVNAYLFAAVQFRRKLLLLVKVHLSVCVCTVCLFVVVKYLIFDSIWDNL